MKKTKSIGSKKFWKILAILLVVFVCIASSAVVVCCKVYDSRKAIATTQVQKLEESGELDQSYEAVRERVNSINENYGQEVKSTYYGQTSTMEKMMQQRMFFSNLKSVFIIILILLVILLVLVKGFGLALFKRRKFSGDTENTEKPEEKAKEETSTAEEEQAPTSEEPEETEEPKETEPEENETDEESQDADDAEVTENCQLP